MAVGVMEPMVTVERLSAHELVLRHQAEVPRYLRYLGCDYALADDLAQDTFIAVLARPPEEWSAGETRSYLRTVARNNYLMALRKQGRRPVEVEIETAEEVWSETYQADGGDEWLGALDDCLSRLDGRAKDAIERFYRNNESRETIAAALEMTTDGVKSLLRRTRDMLRQCVEGKMKGQTGDRKPETGS